MPQPLPTPPPLEESSESTSEVSSPEAPITKLTAQTLGGLRIQEVADSDLFINLLVFGDPGVGKTVLAGSASAVEEMSPVIVVDIEGGTLSLRATYPNVDVVRVKNWTDMQMVYDELRSGKSGYKTVVMDSLTECQKFSMLQIMKDLVAENSDRDSEVPGLREWGKNIEQTRRVVRAFRDLPMHAIFTALAMDVKNDRTGVVTTKPSLSGKLSSEVAGFVDEVLYYYIKDVAGEQKRLLLSQKTDRMIAKDRSGRLPVVVEEPTMQVLYNYIINAQQSA